MRSQPNYLSLFCLVADVDGGFVVVVFDVDVVVQVTLKVYLRLFVMEVEIEWVVVAVSDVQNHYNVKPNLS